MDSKRLSFLVSRCLPLLAAGLLHGCVAKEVRSEAPAPEPVEFSVGLLPIDVEQNIDDRVVAEMESTGLFESVELVRSRKQANVDVILTVVNNLKGMKFSPSAMRPDVSAASAYSRKVLRSWKAPCQGFDTYCINGKLIARELAEVLRAGGPAHDQLMAEKRAAAPPSPVAALPAPAFPESGPSSDVDHPAARKPEDPKNFALVIGIGSYKSLPEAKFGVRDAETVRDHLIAQGYPRRNVILLTGNDATLTGMQKYVEEWLPRNLGADSRLFVYYSGHGAPDPKTGEAYLVPWDGDPQFLQSTAYPVRKLYASLGGLKSREVLVALDSCFSGAGGRSVLPSGARPLVSKVDMGVPSGRLTVLAAASGEEIAGALEAEGHGMFTYFFLKGLSGEAGAGEVSAKALWEYLKPRVQDEARRQNREQTPLLLGSPDARVGR